MADYIPTPIDTSDIELPEGVDALVEQLAKNTHDVWAANRMAQGWQYGEQRDDERKLHPCLIPYEELPESEKLYDRATSLESIKCIIALGYIIKHLD